MNYVKNILFCIAMMHFSSVNLTGQIVSNKETNFVPEWSKGIVWYQIFPERFRNGDAFNDPTLEDQKGCWPHDSLRPWEVHPWGSDWYKLQPYEKSNGNDIWYNITRRRYGGDLQGIIDKLNYLSDLGIGAIYLNPVFVAPSHHKYDIAYYHHIEPTFGPDPKGDWKIIQSEIPDDPSTWKWTRADSLALLLIKEAHNRNIRIIFDGVFNHVGYNHFAFQDVLKNLEKSRFTDWFIIKSFKDPEKETGFEYEGWWGVKDMPELREDEHGIVAGPRKYIFDITLRWMDPDGDGDPSDGIDGWRLDVAHCVDHAFWKDWHKHVREINPEAYMTAEVIDAPDKMTTYLEGDEFDAVMNYNFTFIASDYFINKRKGINAKEFDHLLAELRNAYNPENTHAMQNLMGSHDTHRFSSRIVNADIVSFREISDFFDKTKANNPEFKTRKPNDAEYSLQKLMVIFQMTYSGAPMIYYGDEFGMWGAGDPCCRKPMIWDDIGYQDEKFLPDGTLKPYPETVEPNMDLYEHYRTMTDLRNNNPALKKGEYKTLKADGDIFAFERRSKEQTVIIVLNKGEKPQRVVLNVDHSGSYHDLISNHKPYEPENGTMELEIPAGWGMVLTRFF